MKLGIIGKPQSGKTTIFNAAAGGKGSAGDFSYSCHKAVIKVPDDRLLKLAEIVKPKKTTYADIEFLDAPGFKGEIDKVDSIEIHPDIRQQDAFILVVDCFSEVSNPRVDVKNLIDEMILLDQVFLENLIAKKTKKLKALKYTPEHDELGFLKRCLEHVEKEKPLIDMTFTGNELKIIKGYMLLSLKPLLIVLNIGEDNLSELESSEEKYLDLVAPGKREIAVVCGKIESELVELNEDDKNNFLDELGIFQPAMEKVIQKSYKLMGLISFLTAGEPEVRAWTISEGMNAQQAAGAIHSDIERGFICAEVINYEDYVKYKTTAAIKAAGKMRLEGKSYKVKDGDVFMFRFNL